MRPTAIIAAVASLALLPACTEETEPSPMPTSEDALTTATEEPEDEAVTSEPVETTEEPTTEEPDEPTADSGAMTEESATAAVEDFLSTLESVHRGEAPIDDFAELFTENCATCQAFANRAETDPSPDDLLLYVNSEALLAGKNAQVDTRVRQSIDDAEANLIFDLDWEGERWIVNDILFSSDGR